MLYAILNKIFPRAIMASLSNYRILSRDYGHYNSASHWQSKNRKGEPIPWYSYPMIEYLGQLDFSQKIVFEYGSGNSTLFWASRSKQVVSIEDDPVWYNQLKDKLPANVEYILVENKDDYVKSIQKFGKTFDVIIVDGSHRFDCVKTSRDSLSESGFIILDNSDWFTNSTAFLRSTNLIEVDMPGFNPINGYVSTTSLFLSRQVDLRPSGVTQPRQIIGGIDQQLD